jgi:hypothetical protein
LLLLPSVPPLSTPRACLASLSSIANLLRQTELDEDYREKPDEGSRPKFLHDAGTPARAMALAPPTAPLISICDNASSDNQ